MKKETHNHRRNPPNKIGGECINIPYYKLNNK